MSKNESHAKDYSPEEKQLIEAVRENPSLLQTMNGLIQNFNLEVGKGINELEAELMITNITKEIGSRLINDWAHKTEADSINKAQDCSQKTIKRGKKKSTGIPHSDASN